MMGNSSSRRCERIGQEAISLFAFAIGYSNLRASRLFGDLVTLMLPSRCASCDYEVARLGMLASDMCLTLPLIARHRTFLFRQSYDDPRELAERAHDGAGPSAFSGTSWCRVKTSWRRCLSSSSSTAGTISVRALTTREDYYTIVIGISA